MALSLLGLWPSLAITVKRLHDRGRSGWFLLILLIPVLGPIWLLIETWFLPGDQGANRFGDSPQDKGLPLQWVVPLEVVGVAAVVSLLVWTFLLSGEPLLRALKANDYELLRMEIPVAGKVPLAKGNSLILMQVDGTAVVGDVEISRCARYDISDLLPNPA